MSIPCCFCALVCGRSISGLSPVCAKAFSSPRVCCAGFAGPACGKGAVACAGSFGGLIPFLISGAVLFCLFRNSVIVDDWALGFQIGVQNLFIYSTILFLKILAANREKIKFFTFNAIFLGLVFFMHFLAGSYYFLKIFYGGYAL